MNRHLMARFVPLLLLFVPLVGACAATGPNGATDASPGITSTPAPTNSTSIYHGCTAPDAATMAGIDLLAPAAQPGLTVTLVNEPYVVKADDTWEAVAFWYILEGSPISYPGNVQVYAVKISSAADVSTWVNITSQPYNDDPAKWPSWSKADIALFAAAHTAAGCTGGG